MLGQGIWLTDSDHKRGEYSWAWAFVGCWYEPVYHYFYEPATHDADSGHDAGTYHYWDYYGLYGYDESELCIYVATLTRSYISLDGEYYWLDAYALAELWA